MDRHLQKKIRRQRNKMLRATDWRMARAKEQVQLGIVPADNRTLLARYRQFLRDIPQQAGWWEQSVPRFEEWMAAQGLAFPD
jgi:hypothetical protein